MDKIQELSLEQLHYDLCELRVAVESQLAELPELIADAMPQAKELKHVDVTVKNPSKEFDGQVVVKNEVLAKISNLADVAEKLDGVISSIESQTSLVGAKNKETADASKEIRSLLKQLIGKETTVNVAAPEVKVDVPDSVEVNNWPTSPTKPVPVRLSDGKQFYTQLQQIISSGGGGGVAFARLWDGNRYNGNIQLTAVESIDSPGVYGLVMLNPDGSTISAGDGTLTPTTYERETSDGDTRVTDTGDIRIQG